MPHKRMVRILAVMRDRDLYATILGLKAPWTVAHVDVHEGSDEVEVFLEASPEAEVSCPKCGEVGPRHDHRERRWRHLDTCQFKTTLVARIPRVRCAEHGALQVRAPWAEPGSGFTTLFEAWVIDWLRDAPISAVAAKMRITWDQADGIMQRAVRRGLARRRELDVTRIGVDETSFQKRHEYVTVVTDLESSCVVYVADDRKKSSLQGFFDEIEPWNHLQIEVVAMDMWKPYIRVVEDNLFRAHEKICFDKFHVAQHLGAAVDKVRRQENRVLTETGDRTLVGSKFAWLGNPETMSDKGTRLLEKLKSLALKTGRAWALKEHAMCIWHYKSRGWARRAWEAWISWAMRSRLEPVKKVARMVRDHLEGILNAIVHQATNAGAESTNSRIQRVKRMACGFRSRERFRNAIYFHLGGLDLSPATHTDS